MLLPGDVISYLTMCQEEGVNLQRGMNFLHRPQYSVLLTSVRKGSPYADRVEQNGQVLIYEGHDISRTRNGKDPKSVDQPMSNPGGTLTQNGLFFQSAKNPKGDRMRVKVYEKIHAGIWVFNGFFRLMDAWQELSGNRNVFKFLLRIEEDQGTALQTNVSEELDHTRIIPSNIKREVWKRDQGKCIQCGKTDNLHFDHIIPFSKGGSSLIAENIQLLCVRHNLAKRDKIE